MRFLVAFAFSLASQAALAQDAATAKILPANATAADSVMVEFRIPGFACPALDEGPSFSNGVIGVSLTSGPCRVPPGAPGTGRITLGRLPAGTYTLVMRNSGHLTPTPPPYITQTFTIDAYHVGIYSQATLDEDLSGHWQTDNPGEGLVITQRGDKAFMLFATYDPAGNSRWLVVPDAKRDDSLVAGNGPVVLSGNAYEARGFPSGHAAPPPGATGTVSVVARIEIVLPTLAFDRATVNVRYADSASRQFEIRRFRF